LADPKLMASDPPVFHVFRENALSLLPVPVRFLDNDNACVALGDKVAPAEWPLLFAELTADGELELSRGCAMWGEDAAGQKIGDLQAEPPWSTLRFSDVEHHVDSNGWVALALIDGDGDFIEKDRARLRLKAGAAVLFDDRVAHGFEATEIGARCAALCVEMGRQRPSSQDARKAIEKAAVLLRMRLRLVSRAFAEKTMRGAEAPSGKKATPERESLKYFQKATPKRLE